MSATARAKRRRWARPSIAPSRKKSSSDFPGPVSEHSQSVSIDDAIAAFNRGAYFEAAEMFETASHSADDDLKGLIVAFNQIAAAFHLRFERGGLQASINLMSQAMIARDDIKPARGGVDVERLGAQLAAYTDEVPPTPSDQRA